MVRIDPACLFPLAQSDGPDSGEFNMDVFWAPLAELTPGIVLISINHQNVDFPHQDIVPQLIATHENSRYNPCISSVSCLMGLAHVLVGSNMATSAEVNPPASIVVRHENLG
ncbi:hypothetical protein NL676_011765 [Syzygium grande]|nr:hypothetical protein NL676_011765 [Syzygium grande]